MFTFRPKYLLLTLLLFVVEVLIALYVRDRFIRPFGGDFLVVILLYCALRTVLNAKPWKLALFVLLFACGIEALQYLHIVDRLGLRGNRVARIVIGTGFDWLDLLAYVLGVAMVLVVERRAR
jgi:hypothetical protein